MDRADALRVDVAQDRETHRQPRAIPRRNAGVDAAARFHSGHALLRGNVRHHLRIYAIEPECEVRSPRGFKARSDFTLEDLLRIESSDHAGGAQREHERNEADTHAVQADVADQLAPFGTHAALAHGVVSAT